MLDELKIRYKEMAFGKRMALCFLIGIFPGVSEYLTLFSDVHDQYEQAVAEEKDAADKLVTAENQLKNLQKTQNELEFTKDQLKKAESHLPDQVQVDEILRTVGKVSRDLDVNVVLFEPKTEVIRGGDFKYSELPVKISVSSNDYNQICEWVDKFAGSKSRVYLKSWELIRGAKKAKTESIEMNAGNPSLVADSEAQRTRDDMRITLVGEFSLYKMPNPTQLAAAEAKEKAEAEAAAKAAKKKSSADKAIICREKF
jgi:Tfp pilus assembly protein PilO